MQLKQIEIIKYRNFENIVIDFEKSNFPNIFSIASKNGGGKSTLLQFIFILLHCFNNMSRQFYIQKILTKEDSGLVHFIIEEDEQEYNLDINLNNIYNDSGVYWTTDMTDKQLAKLSNSIYLTLPDAQPLHFLSKEDDKEEMRKLLPNFSTYEFPTEESILNSFEHEKQEDFKEMRIHGQYGSNYITFQNELKDFIEGKEIGENEDGTKIIFKLKDSDKELLSEDLSHGELRKLGIYIWLKSIVKKDAIILMDEVDIALHPSWQYELVDDLIQWSKGSQFLLATHSPQILSSTYYKNLILLDKKENLVSIKRLKEPPLDRDVNIMLKTIMGADYFPKELKKLQEEYRDLFDNGESETQKAQKVKLQILEYESENSSFFQGIAFDKELQDI